MMDIEEIRAEQQQGSNAYDSELYDEIVALWDEGYSRSEIIAALDIDKSMVERARSRSGVDAREQTDAERELDPTIGDGQSRDVGSPIVGSLRGAQL